MDIQGLDAKLKHADPKSQCSFGQTLDLTGLNHQLMEHVQTMHMAATMVLPFIMPPEVLNFELGLYNFFEEQLLALLKVIGSNSRIIIQIIHPCVI